MLPPALGVVNQSHEQQREVNVRAYAGLDFTRGLHALHMKAAWLYYRQEYDKWYAGDYSIPKEIRINRTRGKGLLITRLPRGKILCWGRA